MKIKWRSFSALSKQELYSIMHLRQQVFVVEQNCPFIDADFNDEHCDHMLGYQNNELVAYLRLIKPGIQYQGPSIGRVITIEKIRGQGIGKLITLEAMDFSARKYPEQEITLSAQYRLLSFYEDLGFVSQGEIYLEDDIDHIKMIITPPKVKGIKSLKRFITFHPLLILGFSLALGIVGFSFIKEVDLDQINWIAKIDERAISKAKYESYLSSIAESRKLGLVDSDPQNILERMIDEELLIQRAIDLGMLEHNSEIRSIIIQKMINSIIAETNDLRFSKQDLEEFFNENKGFFTPSPKLHLLKLSFSSTNKDKAQLARDFLLAGNPLGAKELAEPEVIKLPNTLLPAIKVREYIGPFLTQEALKLEEGEVSDLINLDDQIHLLIVVRKLIQTTPTFDELYEEIESEFIRSKGEEMLDEYLMDLRNWYDVIKADEL